MRVLHLSDLHLQSNRLLDFSQYYLKALLDDIQKENALETIDLVVVTGDLIHQGGNSFTGKDPYFELERAFVEPLLQVIPSSVPFLFCPGNHDLDLTKLDKMYEAGFETALIDSEITNAFIDKERSGSHGGLEKQAAFRAFIKRQTIPGSIAQYITNFESCYIFPVQKQRVGVACLNSSWRCSPKLPVSSFSFGSRQILNASDFFKENKATIRIALLHHSPAHFVVLERREVISFLNSCSFDVVLCGHTHNADVECSIGPQGNLFFATARTAFGNPRENTAAYSPGYTLLSIDKGKNQAKCKFRKYVHLRVSFDKDVELAPDGEQSYPLKMQTDRSGFQYRWNLVQKIYQARSDEIDSSLVVYGTDTVAPKNLDQLFIMPILTNAPPTFSGSSKVTYGRVADLISRNGRYVIIGPKESGKSTLLNKVFCELCQDFPLYGLVPVFLHFSDLDGKRIVTLIQRSLNEPLKEVKELLAEGAIAIIVDDLLVSEEETSVRSINEIKAFLDEYPRSVFLSSTSEALDILVLSGEHLFRAYDIRPVYIDSIKAKQFRELAQKWFNKRDQEWINNNIEKLIKTFEILRIPHTFFSISLFLWIVEKQTNFRPFNQATLISTFLQFILEGLRFENSKAGSYSYDRKIELLYEIALKMFECGDKSSDYCLAESEALRCIEDNFRLNQRNWDAAEKLREFIEKGILLKKHGRIAFHFESFFQYLLSINIEKKADFRKKVFDPANILSFIDEIDFYTGRNQADKKTLKQVFGLLEESFRVIDKMFNNEIDTYLPQSSRIIRDIDEGSFVKNAQKKKLSDEGIGEALSAQFDALPVSTTIRAKERIEDARRFHGALALAARVLKNSENVKDPELINACLDSLLLKSARYGLYVQSSLVQEMRKDLQGTFPFLYEVVGMLALIINELLLLNWLGTDFIEIPLGGYMERALGRRNFRELSILSIRFDLYGHAFLELYSVSQESGRQN